MRTGLPDAAVLAILIALPAAAGAQAALDAAPDAMPAAPTASPADAQQIVIVAPEPRYVVPTRLDRIGRIWAPVWINGRGPFRLVLDTGANRSALGAAVVAVLGIDLSAASTVTLHGATGARQASAVTVDRFAVGDLPLHLARLPVIQDAFGGADGVLGTDDLLDKRIVVDFEGDAITVSPSRERRAPPGFVTVAVDVERGLLIVPEARFGSLRVRAIIDTGAQSSIANVAAGEALRRRYPQDDPAQWNITGVTLDVEQGEVVETPPLLIGDLKIGTTRIAVADTYFFRHFDMTAQPTVVIGMDILGLLDTLIIDYPRQELQVRTRPLAN